MLLDIPSEMNAIRQMERRIRRQNLITTNKVAPIIYRFSQNVIIIIVMVEVIRGSAYITALRINVIQAFQ